MLSKRSLFLCAVFISVRIVMAQPALIKEARSFGELFEGPSEIRLMFGQEQVADINQVYMSHQGNFLLLDTRFHEVYLVDSQGRLIRKINIEKNIPGYPLQPVAATFFRDGHFLIYNAPMSLLFFDETGRFVKRHRFTNINNYRSFCVDANGMLYGYTASTTDVFITKMDTSNCNVLSESGEYPDGHLGFIYRVAEGGSMYADDESRVFQSHVSSPDLYVYNQNLALQSVVRLKPPFFNEYPKDQDGKFGDTGDIVGMLRLMKRQTLNVSILPLNEDVLLLQFLIPKEGFGLAFYFLKTGDVVVAKNLRYRDKIVAARDNRVYTIRQVEDETQANPVILAYQWKGFGP